MGGPDLLGRSLLEYWRGTRDVSLCLEHSDGRFSEVPVSVFFRGEGELFQSERSAMREVAGTVLVVGAGAGVHALPLKESGHQVTAIDISPGAVEVMRARGVDSVICEDFFEHRGQYDSVVMLGRNIGICEELSGLPDLLLHCSSLLRDGGRLIGSSAPEPRPRSMVDGSGYPGNLQFRIRYGDGVVPWVRWLHVDYQTLRGSATSGGWTVREVARVPDGSYSVVMVPP